MNCQMMRVISSPSSSTTFPVTLILAIEKPLLLLFTLPQTVPADVGLFGRQVSDRSTFEASEPMAHPDSGIC